MERAIVVVFRGGPLDVCLRGSSPSATTAGIMLLTRARQLGYPLNVSIIGDFTDIIAIPGPAVTYAPVLASCGVGREAGSGATVVVPGPPGAPVMVTVHPHGVSGWFYVDRSGNGHHPATQAYVRLTRDPRPGARELGRMIRRTMEVLGCSTDPCVLDILFGADVAPLTRLAVALRAGRAMNAAGGGEPITRYTTGTASGDPLPPHYDLSMKPLLMEGDGLMWIINGLSPVLHDGAERFIALARELAMEDGGRDLILIYQLAEVASELVQLPPRSILPPLGAAEDSVATGLQNAMTADGDGDANKQLVQVFRFLGGKFVESSDHSYDVGQSDAPKDHIARWEWFSSQVRHGRKQADMLWGEIFDPAS